jgi:hypothetical protein
MAKLIDEAKNGSAIFFWKINFQSILLHLGSDKISPGDI